MTLWLTSFESKLSDDLIGTVDHWRLDLSRLGRPGSDAVWDLPQLLSEGLDRWNRAERVVVDASEAEADLARALRLLWTVKILPSVFLTGRAVEIARRDMVDFQEAPGYLGVLRKPMGVAALERMVKAAFLNLVSRPVNREIQKAWHNRTVVELERRLGHEEVSKIGAARFLRGARELGLMTPSEYRTAARALGATGLADLSGVGGSAKRPATRAKILLIDDEAYWEKVLSGPLLTRGIELTQITTAWQGLEFLKRSPAMFSAVVLDLRFPHEKDLTPYQLLQGAVSAAPHLPVVVFSGETDGRVVQSLAADSFHYFFKVVEPVGEGDPIGYVTSLLDTVENAVNEAGSFAARALVRSVNPPSPARELLLLQAGMLKQPLIAMTTYVALWTLNCAPTSGFVPQALRLLRNYGAHLEGEPHPPTTYEALSGFLLWLELFVEEERRPDFHEGVARVLTACGKGADDPFLVGLGALAVQDTKQRWNVVNGLKTKIPRKVATRRLRVAIDPRSRYASHVLLRYAYDWNRGDDTVAGSIARALLLKRVQHLCA